MTTTIHKSRLSDRQTDPSDRNCGRIIARRQSSEIAQDIEDFVVLLGRIELPTSSLPMTRSTTELQQLAPNWRRYAKGWS